MNKAMFQNIENGGKPDKKEEAVFRQADLEIRDPQLEKGLLVTYNADGEMAEKAVAAYAAAVREVLKDRQIFHQLGSADPTGMQGWELWQKTDREEIEALLPRIHERAKDLYEQS